jgi:hypothetical protein
MAVEYLLHVKTRAGALVRVVEDARYISYSAKVNAPGLLIFAVNGTHAVIALLERDSQVEVWRRDEAEGIDWYCDFYGLFVDEMRASPTTQEETEFTAYCVGQMDFLARSVVAYPAGVANRSKHTAQPAETILKNLVKYNATASGTTGDGRVLNVPAWGGFISLEADGAGGNTLTRELGGRNLLAALQEIAAVGDLDFWLAKTGAQAWEFRTDDTLGDDRSATVKFALQYGNMRNPVLKRNRIGEATVAVVGGAGEELARIFRTRTGTNYNATYNAREIWVNESQSSSNNELDAAGDAALYLAEARDDLSFSVIQTPARLYGRDYFLGDLVTGYYQGVTSTKQIAGVTVTYKDSKNNMVETIDIVTENP